MKARQVHPRARHQRRQAQYKILRLERHMRRAIPVRRLQRIANLALRSQRQPLRRHRRAADVAAQPLELAALLGLRRYARVQRKTVRLRQPFPAMTLAARSERLQREGLLALAPADRHSVRDRVTL